MRVFQASFDSALKLEDGIVFDSNFFARKAEALLRFAEAAGDPTIEDRMRDQAAHCHSQADFLRDNDEHAEDCSGAVTDEADL